MNRVEAPDVLFAGSLALDRLERDGRVALAWGGAVVYGGCTAADAGCRVRVWTAAPADTGAEAARAFPELDWAVMDAPRATRFRNRELADGTREQRCPSRAPALEVSALPAGGERWVHLGPLHPDDIRLDAARALRARTACLTLDVQGLTRRVDADGGVGEGLAPHVEDWLALPDWVKASLGEWEVLRRGLGLADPPEALRRFGWRGLLLTAGREGGVAWRPDAPPRRWAAVPAARVRCETGAGDVFCARFTAARLAGPEAGLDRWLAEASATAAAHVGSDGARWARSREGAA
jgi:hypothetical protein